MSEDCYMRYMHDGVPASCVGHIYTELDTSTSIADVNPIVRRSLRQQLVVRLKCTVQTKTVARSCRAIYTTFTKVTQVLHHT